MEYMEGRSLSQEHSCYPLTILELKTLAEQVAKALCHVHELGYVHGDISLETIWLKSRQPIYVKLFGFKDVTDDGENLTNLSAPEVRAGEQYTSKADIWSLGITLMEILLSQPKHNDANILSYHDLVSYLAIVGQQYESGRRFLFSLLQKDPSRRLVGQDLLHDNFFKVEKGDASLALPLLGPIKVPSDGQEAKDDVRSIPDTAIPDGASEDDDDDERSI